MGMLSRRTVKPYQRRKASYGKLTPPEFKRLSDLILGGAEYAEIEDVAFNRMNGRPGPVSRRMFDYLRGKFGVAKASPLRAMESGQSDWITERVWMALLMDCEKGDKEVSDLADEVWKESHGDETQVSD